MQKCKLSFTVPSKAISYTAFSLIQRTQSVRNSNRNSAWQIYCNRVQVDSSTDQLGDKTIRRRGRTIRWTIGTIRQHDRTIRWQY